MTMVLDGISQATAEQKEQIRLHIFKLLGYKPFPEQMAIHMADLREPGLVIKQGVGGEQSGKSFLSAKEIMSRFPEGKLYWLAGKSYELCRREFGYCVADAYKLGELVKEPSFPKEGACSMELRSGVVIKTKTLEDIMKIAMESPDGIVICEAAQTTWEVVQRCYTRIGASRGWLLLQGTMEGSQSYYAEKYREWQGANNEHARSFSLPSWSNLAVYPGGREDPKIKEFEETLPEEVFWERLGGVPCPISALITKEFRNETHVADFEFNPDLPVEITVDPGGAFKSGAYCVLALQQWDNTIHVVDEIYYRGYVTEEIIDIAVTRPWWKKVRGGTIDVAAKQHHTTGSSKMSSDADIWYRRTNLYLRSRVIKEGEGIDRVRTFLKVKADTKKPGVLMNPLCKGLISECGGGKSPVHDGGPWVYDKVGKPKDKNNHACKALYYWLVDQFGYVTVSTRKAEVVHLSPFI